MERVPILTLGDALLVSIQVDLQDDSVVALQEDLAERIVATNARGVVIDISAVEIVDSFIGRMFATVAALSRVLDAETVVVGMRPAVAITLVELGLSLEGVRTALDLEKGLAVLKRLGAARAWDTDGRRCGPRRRQRRPRSRRTRPVNASDPGDELPIRTGDDVVRVRQLVRQRAQSARLSLVDQTKLITAASELARNTLVYGGSRDRDGPAGGRARSARASVRCSPTPGRASRTSRRPSRTATPAEAASGSDWAARSGSSTSSTSCPRWAGGRRFRW